MSAKLPAGFEVQGFITITIDNHDGKGPVAQATLPSGQTAAVTSADSGDFSVALDNPAVAAPPDPTTGVVPVTVASFTVVSAATPTQPNVPVNITLSVKNADGSSAAPDKVDTIEVDEAATEAIGDLFGTPIAVPA